MAHSGTDGGWAWIVVLAAFFNHVVIVGIARSFGLIFVELIDEYGGSASATSVLFSLSGALGLFSAPFVTALTEVFTCRSVAFVGACSSALGFFLCSLSSSLEMVIFSYGVFVGLGNGCVLTPGPLMLTAYFEKKRSFASGLVYSGSSVGAILLPYLVYYLIDTYHLNGSLMMLSGIAMQACIFASLYRPMTRKNVLEPKVERLRLDSLRTDTVRTQEFLSPSSLDTSMRIPQSALEAEKQNRWTARRTLSEEYSREQNIGKNPVSVSMSALHRRNSERPVLSALVLATTAGFSLADLPGSVLETYGITTTPVNLSLQGIQSLEVIKEEQEMIEEMPWWKRLFFVRNPDGSWTRLLDFKYFKQPRFLLFAIASALAVNYFWLSMLVPPRAEELEWSRREGAVLLSVSGVSDTVGRVVAGWAGDREWLRSRRILALCLCTMASGGCVLGLVLVREFGTFVGVLLCCAFFCGGITTFTPVVLADLLGAERMPKTWGLLLFVQGFSVVVGPVVIGVLRDLTGIWSAGLGFVGGMILIASIADLILWSWLKKGVYVVEQE